MKAPKNKPSQKKQPKKPATYNNNTKTPVQNEILSEFKVLILAKW